MGKIPFSLYSSFQVGFQPPTGLPVGKYFFRCSNILTGSCQFWWFLQSQTKHAVETMGPYVVAGLKIELWMKTWTSYREQGLSIAMFGLSLQQGKI